MKKTIALTIILIIIIVGAYMYFLRPVAGPTEDISEATQNEQIETVAGEQYRISQMDSQVEFRIDEILRDAPFTAVGTTNQIAGDFLVDSSASPILTIGTITVDARTFRTDSENRDRAISRFILQTETAGNEYITFTPTSVNNLPATITKGQPFSFSVVGDMTIAGVTRPHTLNITATQTDDKLTGTVNMAIKRSDYSLTIPSVPFVASVDNDFTVQTAFVANRVR